MSSRDPVAAARALVEQRALAKRRRTVELAELAAKGGDVDPAELADVAADLAQFEELVRAIKSRAVLEALVESEPATRAAIKPAQTALAETRAAAERSAAEHANAIREAENKLSRLRAGARRCEEAAKELEQLRARLEAFATHGATVKADAIPIDSGAVE